MEFKNRSFRFMDSVYKIRFVDRIPTEEGNTEFGTFDPDRREILIGLRDNSGKLYTREQVMNTIRHELVHLMFFEGQYNTCYVDEPLVEWLAKAIGICLKQKLLE